MDKNLSYQEALSQLEELVAKIEDPQRPLNSLSDDLERAMMLIKYCRESLRDTEDKLIKIIKE
jgi:exodeoxyribonuclease VII small subunit